MPILQTTTDWLIFACMLAFYLLFCYWLLTTPMDIKKVGGLWFVKVSKYQLSFCTLRNKEKLQ